MSIEFFYIVLLVQNSSYLTISGKKKQDSLEHLNSQEQSTKQLCVHLPFAAFRAVPIFQIHGEIDNSNLEKKNCILH